MLFAPFPIVTILVTYRPWKLGRSNLGWRDHSLTSLLVVGDGFWLHCKNLDNRMDLSEEIAMVKMAMIADRVCKGLMVIVWVGRMVARAADRSVTALPPSSLSVCTLHTNTSMNKINPLFLKTCPSDDPSVCPCKVIWTRKLSIWFYTLGCWRIGVAVYIGQLPPRHQQTPHLISSIHVVNSRL